MDLGSAVDASSMTSEHSQLPSSTPSLTSGSLTSMNSSFDTGSSFGRFESSRASSAEGPEDHEAHDRRIHAWLGGVQDEIDVLWIVAMHAEQSLADVTASIGVLGDVLAFVGSCEHVQQASTIGCEGMTDLHMIAMMNIELVNCLEVDDAACASSDVHALTKVLRFEAAAVVHDAVDRQNWGYDVHMLSSILPLFEHASRSASETVRRAGRQLDEIDDLSRVPSPHVS